MVARILAVVLPPLAGLILTPLRGDFSQATLAVLFVLVIVIVAAAADRIASLIVAVSAAVWFEFFFSPPYFSFQIASTDDIELMVLMALVALAVGELARWGVRSADVVARTDGYLDGILDLAPGQAGPEGNADEVASRIKRVLGSHDDCRFQEGEGSVMDARVDRDGTVTQRGVQLDVREQGLPADRFLAIPVTRGGRTVGHFRLSTAAGVLYPTPQQLKAAIMLADQYVPPATPATPPVG